MTVLITGVNGFIGRHLAVHLLKLGYEVNGIGLSSNCLVNNINNYFSGTILDSHLVNKIIKNTDVVIHLAAITGHSEIVNQKYKTFDINFRGTLNILNAYKNSERANKFIYTSTGKVYGKIVQNPIIEKTWLQPLNILGKSKHITEQLIDFYSDIKKEFIIFRMFQIYGPNQKNNFLIPSIISQVLSGSGNQRNIILGDIKAQRDYVYIDDAVKAFVKAIDQKMRENINIFNICSGIPTSAEDIIQLFSKILDIEIEVKITKALIRHDEENIEYGSYKKAKSILNWSPIISLEDGLRKTLDAKIY